MKIKDRTFYNEVLITQGLKLCSSCEKIKTLDNYSVNNRLSSGLQSSCKSCIKNMYQSKSYREKELKRIERYKLNGKDKESREKRKNKIQNAYNKFKEKASLELIEKGYKQIKQNQNFYINEYGDVKKIPAKNQKNLVGLNWQIEDAYVRENYYGYLKFNMNAKMWRVHQIVAQEYLGHTMCGHKLVVDHIDGNILNNHYKNLQVVSNHENLMKGRYSKTKEEKFLKYIKDIER
jgi:hypothetical protein